MKRQHPYQAYLLRCWRERDANHDAPIWRFSLEGVRDNQRHGFADLQALLTFLQHITQTELDSDASSMLSQYKELFNNV